MGLALGTSMLVSRNWKVEYAEAQTGCERLIEVVIQLQAHKQKAQDNSTKCLEVGTQIINRQDQHEDVPMTIESCKENIL